MALALLFILGIANFAIHKAVLESGHPLVEALPSALRRSNGRLSLLFEFTMLLTAMLAASNGWQGATLVYFLYTAFNLFAGWLLLDRRI